MDTVNCEAGFGADRGVSKLMANKEFKSTLKATVRGGGGRDGVPQPREALDGIYQKFGQSLPHVGSVRGQLMISDVSTDVINGFLITGDHRIRVRFESKARGPFPVLRRHLESLLLRSAYALSIASFQANVSGRAWVEQDGTIVLLVRSFEIDLPSEESISS